MPFLETRETLNEMVPHTYHELRSRLRIALAFNAIIIVAEFVGGFLTNSIGIIGDAGHNLVDQGSLFLALYAHVLTAKPATDARTFGYHRAGIVAAFLNSFILILTAVGITLVSFQRLMTPVPVPGGWVMLIAWSVLPQICPSLSCFNRAPRMTSISVAPSGICSVTHGSP